MVAVVLRSEWTDTLKDVDPVAFGAGKDTLKDVVGCCVCCEGCGAAEDTAQGVLDLWGFCWMLDPAC